jgi:hypothetical protein
MQKRNKRQKNQRFFSHTFFLRKNRKGTILTENIVFIVLTLVFLTILILFIFSKMGDVARMEERYAKQIALLVDSSEPVMTIGLNMEDAIEKAEKEGRDLSDLVSIEGNIVNVQLREKGGYSYSFFSDVKVEDPYFNQNNLILIINPKGELENE